MISKKSDWISDAPKVQPDNIEKCYQIRYTCPNYGHCNSHLVDDLNPSYLYSFCDNCNKDIYLDLSINLELK